MVLSLLENKYLLGWMDTTIDKIITIVDEAHNLPDWSRDAAADALSVDSLRRASQESNKLGLLLGDGSPPTLFLDLIESALRSLGEFHIAENDDEGEEDVNENYKSFNFDIFKGRSSR